MKRLILVAILCSITFLGCSEEPVGNSISSTLDISALNEQDTIVSDVKPEDVYSIWTDPCVECMWYFCPPYGAIWQKQICINKCEDPSILVFEGECEEHLECNPSKYLIQQLECTTAEGYPGLQDKVCDKGHIKYTDCTTNCDEETCDYEDNDCDGVIDEDQLNDCGACGIIPPETCNTHDDDCDGDIDEDLFVVCYEATEETLGVGECSAGQSICVAGAWSECLDQVLRVV